MIVKLKERAIEYFIRLGGLIAILALFAIFIFLLKEGIATFNFVSIKDLFLGKHWYPISSPPSFGILPLILGSLLVTAGAMVIALPLGIASAFYIAEVAPDLLREILKPVIEMLAAIPSVVLGFIGLTVVAPYIRTIFNLPTGLTALTGSLMLAFMALPTIISISEDAIRSVPTDFKEASLALGANRFETMLRVTLPAAFSGIIAAVMLGLGRVIGETMAVLMVTGNAALIPISFLQPVRTMTATIAAEMGETVVGSPHYHALFTIGLVLFLIAFVINLVADLGLHRFREMVR